MGNKTLKGIALILFGILLCTGSTEINRTILYNFSDFPFDNTIEKGTDLYNRYNTNIHEKRALEKSKNAVDNG